MALESCREILKPYLLPDEVFDRAYEKIDPYFRGLIKKAISINYSYLGSLFSAPWRQITKEEHKNIRFFSFKKKRSIIIVLSKEMYSPSQLISLALAPRMLDIEVIVVGCFDIWPSAIVLSLELLGILDVYGVSEEILYKLIKNATNSEIFAFLGEDLEIEKKDFLKKIIFFRPPKKALVIEEKKDSQRINLDHIKFSHPQMEIKKVVLEDNNAASIRKTLPRDIDVIYSPLEFFGMEELENMDALFLGPGYETFWVWKQMFEEMFFNRNYVFF